LTGHNPNGNRLAIAALSLLMLGRMAFSMLAFSRPALALANDTDRYVPIANGILAGTAYAWNTERPGELLNTVGYPAFLAAVFGTLGRAPGDVALAQLFITGVLAVALYAVLARRVGLWPALAASLVFGLDPLTTLWSLTVLTEALCAVLIGGAALALVSWRERPSMPRLVLAGILLAASALVKPYVLLLAILWTIAIFMEPGGAVPVRTPIARRFIAAMVFLVPALVFSLPWFARNMILWHCPSLSSVDRITMRDYVAAKILQETDGISLDAAQTQLRAADPGVCPKDGAKYAALVLAHPMTYLRLHVAGTIPVFLGTSFDRWLEYFGKDFVMPDLWRPYMDDGLAGVGLVLWREFIRSPTAVALMPLLTAWQLLVYALAALGLFSSLGKSSSVRWEAAIFALSALILMLSPGQGGHERFRVPAQPLLAILSAYGVLWLMLRCRRRAMAADLLS
jgi:hypothetical protein